jgi:excisionase family DNA binding protein
MAKGRKKQMKTDELNKKSFDPEQPEERPSGEAPPPPPVPVAEPENDCPMLPKKALFRIDEVARYFDVSERTIRIWIDHGHLVGERVVGSIRVSRESILTCRFRNR